MLGVLAVERIRIDDPIGAVAVHGLAGVWGTLATGIFAVPALADNLATGTGGLWYTGSFHQLGVQALGLLAVGAFTFSASFGALWAMKATFGIRVEPEVETAGLDVSEHGMWGYPEFYIPVPGGYGTEAHGHLGLAHAQRRTATRLRRARPLSVVGLDAVTRGSEGAARASPGSLRRIEPERGGRSRPASSRIAAARARAGLADVPLEQRAAVAGERPGSPTTWSARRRSGARVAARHVDDDELAAAHARADVPPDLAEHDDEPAGHVLAERARRALDDGDRARVAHGEALAGAAGARRARRPSRRRAPRCRAAPDRRRRRPAGGSTIRPAAHRLADVVVRLADERRAGRRRRGTRRSSGRPSR